MTSHDEQRLSDALRREAAGQDPHLLSLDDVTSRARGIRRRRVATGIVAAAAVAAVVVPTGLMTAGGNDRSDSQFATQTPDATATQGPTPSQPTQPPATPTGATTVELGADLPVGAAPLIPVRLGEYVLVPGSGKKVFTGTGLPFFSPLGDQWVGVQRGPDGKGTFVVFDAEGTTVLREPANPDGALAVSPDRTAAAYVGTDGRIHSYTTSDGDLTLSEPIGGSIQLASMTGSGSCREEAGGCQVLFNKGRGGVGTADSHGIVDDVPGFEHLGGASADAYVGIVSVSDEGSCSEARGIDDQQTIWRTCDHTPMRWSPDGRYLTAGPAYLDGLCCAQYDVLDGRTGASVVAIDAGTSASNMSYIHSLAWEDETHVLALVFLEDRWTFVRVGLDGSAEIAGVGTDIGKTPDEPVASLPVAP